MSGIFSAGGAGNVGVSGFYPVTINDSLRFEDGSSAYLNRTFSSAPTSTTTSTFSAWAKRGNLGQYMIWTSYVSGPNIAGYIYFNTSNKLQVYVDQTSGGSDEFNVTTDAVFRDPSAFYHIVVKYDLAQASNSNKIKIYVNGELQSATYAQTGSAVTAHRLVSNGTLSNIGQSFNNTNFYDGYLSDIYFIDGQALDPTSFGEAKDGTWIPKSYSGSYGTNGFHLEFNSNTNDTSGNSNNWTANNISAHDYVPDSPTNNFATLNPLDNTGQTLSEGNLKFYNNASSHKGARGNFGMASDKWYFECTMSSISSGDQQQFGLARQNVTCPTNGSAGNTFMMYWGGGNPNNNYIYNDGSNTGVTAQSVAVGDVLRCAYDADTGKLWLGKNSDWYNSSGAVDGSANPATGTNPTMTLSETEPLVAWVHSYSNAGTFNICNFGQDSSFSGNKTAQGNSDANGNGDFYYSVPSGYLALCSDNLPEPVVGPLGDSLSDENFNTVLYSGTGANQSITGVGFEPSLVWIKKRTPNAAAHALWDNVRGTQKWLLSDGTNAQITTTDGLSSFDSDGFTLGADATYGSWNNSGTQVAWNWKAGTAFSNTAGTNGATIASSGLVNTDAGFSIVDFSGTNSAGTIFHGLSAAPEFIVYKRYNISGDGWIVYHKEIPNSQNGGIYLQSPANWNSDSTLWNNTAPTSSVFSVGTYGSVSGEDRIAYCFHSVDGYSKVGSYIGGGSNFPFVYTGFRPAWLMVKNASVANSWRLWDSARPSYNLTNLYLSPDNPNGEGAINIDVDLLSNGFKLRGSNSSINGSGNTIIYLAFAESPAKYSNAR